MLTKLLLTNRIRSLFCYCRRSETSESCEIQRPQRSTRREESSDGRDRRGESRRRVGEEEGVCLSWYSTFLSMSIYLTFSPFSSLCASRLSVHRDVRARRPRSERSARRAPRAEAPRIQHMDSREKSAAYFSRFVAKNGFVY